MNVKHLRDLIAGLPDDMPVCVEVTFNDNDDFEGADLHLATVETRCDEVECLYLWGNQDDGSRQENDDESSSPRLRLVT
jgi:hypothetical protein